MRVLMVDPAAFSPPYDHCLCEALVEGGCHVTLARSSLPASTWNYRTSYTVSDLVPSFPWHSRRFAASRLAAQTAKGIEHVAVMTRLLDLCREFRPHVIHFQWLPLPVVDLWFVRRLRRLAPLVLTLHNTTPYHGAPTSRWQSLGWARVLRQFHRLVVHTEFSRQQVMQRKLFPADRLHVIPHGVFEYYRDLAHHGSESVPGHAHTIFFFGAIKPYKGLDVLLAAFALLPPPLLNRSQLLIAGEPGMDLAPLQQSALQRGISPRVTWRLGFLPEEEVPTLFDAASVIVLPHRDVDQSGVLMTALAFNKPVIASRIGGFPEVLQDGVHGYLFKPGDASELAAALTRVLNDPQRARSMGLAVSQLRSGSLSWKVAAQKSIELYRQIGPLGARLA